VDFINPDHAAIADREADPRAAIDHVAGCEPCARLVDGEGRADAVLCVADLDQNAFIELVNIWKDGARLCVRPLYLGTGVDPGLWSVRPRFLAEIAAGIAEWIVVARAAGKQRPDDHGQHDRINDPVGNPHARLREPLIFVRRRQLTRPPP
jgi:hypothetical protein